MPSTFIDRRYRTKLDKEILRHYESAREHPDRAMGVKASIRYAAEQAGVSNERACEALGFAPDYLSR